MITDAELTEAVRAFWGSRVGGTQSAGHDKAFLELIGRELTLLGWPSHISTYASDPGAIVAGHFRPAKSWDIVCRDEAGAVRVCVEFKSQVDSYGNNENNRYEEALGSGLDLRARYGEDIALGFVFVLCEEPATRRPTRDRLPEVDPVFAGSSHADRREIFARRITEFRLNNLPFYDAAAVLMVGRDGSYRMPADLDLDIRSFAERLVRPIGG